MAKVSGPLMSMDARGKFGGALVFSGWKGRPTVRQLVTPSNPQTAGQQAARNAVRTCGAAQKFANASLRKGAGRLVTDEEAITAITPGGQAWNGHLVKGMTGAGNLTYEASQAAWTALTAPQKSAWDVAAAAMVPPFTQTNQVDVGGVAATPLSAGETMFHYQSGLASLAIAAAPGAVPPVYIA